MSGCQFKIEVDNGSFWIITKQYLFLLTLSTVRVPCIPGSLPGILSVRAWHGWMLDNTHLHITAHLH